MAQHKGSLGGGVFSIREVEYLESLPAVDRVRSGRIVYNDAFKRDCIRRYRNGESPAEIFRSAGLDSALIGYKRIERSIARWKAALGDDGAPAHGPLALHRCNRQPLEPVAAPSSQFRVRPSGPSLPVCRRHCRHRVHRPVRIAAAERARAGPAQPHHRPAGPPHPGTRNRNQRTETRAPRRGRKRYRGGVFYLALFRFRGNGGGIGGFSPGANRLTVGTMLAVEGRPPRRVIYGGSGMRRVGTRSVWKERYARLTSQEERRHPAARVA